MNNQTNTNITNKYIENFLNTHFEIEKFFNNDFEQFFDTQIIEKFGYMPKVTTFTPVRSYTFKNTKDIHKCVINFLENNIYNIAFNVIIDYDDNFYNKDRDIFFMYMYMKFNNNNIPTYYIIFQ